ncbi:MAG: MFS transporter, partial [Cyanobacteria bacterium]|nr:MFS transporter [Cyanobacteriota bacterium]
MTESVNIECDSPALRVDEEARSVVEPILDSHVFVRDRLTWFGYIIYGLWSFLWSAFGAFIPYLRSEFHMSYSTAALHFSALALGPFLAGFFGDRVINSLGLSMTILMGTLGMAFGLILLVCGWNSAITIGGAFFIGLGGNVMSQALTTSMSERFGKQRVIGISEIQIAGTVCGLLAPVAVSFFTRIGLNWRVAVASGMA